jgi:beta-galactosidase
MGSFEIREDFYLNGEKFKIIAGGMHYFRVVPEYWRDRLEKIKALGCNTVETYVAWNMHEAKKGEFSFSGICDIKRFIETAQELGLYVIVRPSPYICAEWEFGGLPAWLMAEDGMRLRSSYKPFLDAVDHYYKELFKILTPLQITKGGPIIMFQIENEYGAYGEDTEYLKSIRDMMVKYGAEVPMFTSDGPWGDYLACGGIPGVLQTANFGSKGHEQFKVLKARTGENKPLMCTEFWVGWFDAWGDEKHNKGDIEEHVKDLDEILAEGSVSIYMAHGGTNFGFTSGANYYDELKPDVTSYDYDALISEDGELTEKYHAFKKVIEKYVKIPEVKFTAEIKKKAYGKAALTGRLSLKAALPLIAEKHETNSPVCMEKLGQNYGYTLYRTELVKDRRIEKFRLMGANDRAKVYLDGKELLTLYDRELLTETKLATAEEKEVFIPLGEGKKRAFAPEGTELSILMENMGRVNYGYFMEKQRKGIDGAVLINGHQHYKWEEYTLPLDNLEKLVFDEETGLRQDENTSGPAFYRYEFEADEQGDTFLDMTGFGKGCAFINGFNLGRFWEIGPQKRLYIPGPLVKTGRNEIIIFETEGKACDAVSLCDAPALE